MQQDHTEKPIIKETHTHAHESQKKAKNGDKICKKINVPKKLLFKTENLKTRFVNAT